MEKVKFDDLFSFQYSDRPMTHASRLDGKVPSDVKKERLRILQEVQNKYCLEKNQAVLHRIEEVLVEGVSKKDPHCMTGKTGANKTVNCVGEEDFRGQRVPVRITDVHLHSLTGERV